MHARHPSTHTHPNCSELPQTQHLNSQFSLGQLGFPSGVCTFSLQEDAELCAVGCVGVETRGSYFFIMCSLVILKWFILLERRPNYSDLKRNWVINLDVWVSSEILWGSQSPTKKLGEGKLYCTWMGHLLDGREFCLKQPNGAKRHIRRLLHLYQDRLPRQKSPGVTRGMS